MRICIRIEGKEIRSVWDAEKEEYCFSIVDVIGALTDSKIPRNYWSDLKRKLIDEGSKLHENIVQFENESIRILGKILIIICRGEEMRKPIIGIIGKVQPQYGEDIWHRIDEVDEIRYLIVKNGGLAIMLLPTEATLKFNDNDIKDNTILSDEEKDELYRQINLCDGFVLQGGLYSSNYEIEMAKRIIELDKPLIGICAGFNNILRALGTDVIEDKTKSHDIYDKNYRHEVTVIKGTKLYEFINKDKYNVNSIHSMIAPKEKVENYATISSISYDGLVESFELNNKKFVIGTKWHPELMLEDEVTKKIFKEFIEECK